MAAGHRRRVMKKVFENGIDTLLEHEFLELCLFAVYKRCDTNPLAHKLIERFGNLEAVCNASVDELLDVEGIGPAAAEYIKLIPYISKGYSIHSSSRHKNKFTTKESMAERCVALLKGYNHEVAYVLCFDNSLHLLKEVKVGEGGTGSVEINPRKIVEAVAHTPTTRIMICHNHPSGVILPSYADMEITKSIERLLNSIGIELIDHVVVSDDEYVSCVPMG
ncbi:MAG: JAB domain-containing protein [Clostridia bacterium]|nr:JAB domain-containing protein [Clostridia bacterium]